jgi:hypothetical protein
MQRIKKHKRRKINIDRRFALVLPPKLQEITENLFTADCQGRFHKKSRKRIYARRIRFYGFGGVSMKSHKINHLISELSHNSPPKKM